MPNKKTPDNNQPFPTATETTEATETTGPRHQQVREKLRKLYGDDTAETVRRFLSDLIRGDETSGKPN